MCGKRISSLLGKITILLIICCCSFSAHAKYGGGKGVPNDPYQIADANDLLEFGTTTDDYDKHFILIADVNMVGYTFTTAVIAADTDNTNDDFDGVPFTGVFDGAGHRILNLTIDNPTGDNDFLGLFGFISSENAQVKNLGLENVSIIGGDDSDFLGGLCGRNGVFGGTSGGTISNCYSTGAISGNGGVGGLVGRNPRGTITNCYSTGAVSGSRGVGGLSGGNAGTISNCYATGSVTGLSYSTGIGGLVGANFGNISDCYATGSVVGEGNVGGLCGYNSDTISNCYSDSVVLGTTDVGGLLGLNDEGIISNSYSNSDVSGNEKAGGLVGLNYYGTVLGCFWDIQTSGQATSDGGMGKTTEQMNDIDTFFAWGVCGNEGIWTIDSGKDYPRLAWQNLHGIPIAIADHRTIYGGGSGEPNDPYLIYTPEQLNTIGLFPCHLDKHFRLMSDIDLSSFTGTSFNIIGIHNDNPFSGVFDGDGHTISNFTYKSTSRKGVGLFGSVNGGQIMDLGLIDPNVDAGTGWEVGSLVGYMSEGTIRNCYAEGGCVSGYGMVGGLVGYNDGTITNCYSTDTVLGDRYVGGLVGSNVVSSYSRWGTIINCYSTGTVLGDRYVGGLVGSNYKGTINNCYSTGSVSGDRQVGGLVGVNRGTITYCYSTGSVSGGGSVGGLVGRNYYATITNCYSAGTVSGGDNVGGLVGYNEEGEVTYSFWDIETSEQSTSSGGTGLPTDEMQMASTFIDAGWDFVGETFNGIEDIWFIPHQDYPHLWWEGMQVPMKMTPRTLNCRSGGNWVKAHITLPEGFTVADVDPDRPAVLHSFGFQSLPLYVFVNKDKVVEIEAAFERQAVCSLADDWPQALTVAGFLSDGNIFLGTSTVRIIHPGMKVIEELANCWLQGDCVHPTWCNGIDMNRDSLVNLADYALLMNINVEFVTDE